MRILWMSKGNLSVSPCTYSGKYAFTNDPPIYHRFASSLWRTFPCRYTLVEIWNMRGRMKNTVALAQSPKGNRTGTIRSVTPWISLGAGYRKYLRLPAPQSPPQLGPGK